MSSMKPRSGDWLRRMAYGALFVVIAAGAALATAGLWLVPAAGPLRPADAIVVLAGGFERSLYAADLYRLGHAPRVWVTRPARERGARQLEELGVVLPREEEVHREILVRRGLPVAAVEVVGSGSLSTVDDARALRARIVAGGATHLLVVTSPAHVRRAAMILDDTLRDRGTAVQVVATPYEHFDRWWWRDQGSARMVVLETAKLAYYLAGGRFTSRLEPAESTKAP